MDDIPSRLQSSEHSDHFHRAGSRNTHQVRIFHPELPGDLVFRLFHLARRIQTHTLADAEQQKRAVYTSKCLHLFRDIAHPCVYRHYDTASQSKTLDIQGGSNMTGTDLCVNKPHCAAAVRP